VSEISQITNIVRTQFQAHGGNVVSTMNQMSMQTGRWGQRLMETSRMSERINAQWRAIGTTMRYALAGGAVFGATKLVTNLKELQRQIGMISVLSGQSAGQVTQMLPQVRQAAVDAVTPIQDLNEGIINFYSSVSNPPSRNQVIDIMKEISLTAQIAQTDVPNASRAITGMLNVFQQPANLQNVQRYTRAITDIINTIPGGAEVGRQMFQQMPVIAAPLASRGGTPQMGMALFETLGRSGLMPSTVGRGLAFALTTVANPGQQRKETQEALASIGITDRSVQQMGINKAFLRVIARARQAGTNVSQTGMARTATDDQLDEVLGQSGIGEQKSQLGLSGGGADFLAKVFARVHALRVASLLATSGENINKDLQQMQDDFHEEASAVRRHKANMKKFTDPQLLAQASISLQGLSQQATLALAPVLNLASRGIIRGEEEINRHHEGAKQIAVGGAAFAAALKTGQLLGVPGLGRLRLGGLLGGAGQKLVQSRAILDAATASAERGHSPQLPLYVVVVEDLFQGSRNNRPTTKGKIGDEVVDDAPWIALMGRKWLRRGASRAGSIFRNRALRGATTAAAAEIGAFGAKEAPWLARAGMAGARFGTPAGIGALIGGHLYNPQLTNQGAWAGNLEMLKKRFGQDVYNYTNPAVGKFHGQGEVWLTLNIQHPNGRVEQKRVHVPLGVGTAPGYKGQPKKR
jgi:hypothetical protein